MIGAAGFVGIALGVVTLSARDIPAYYIDGARPSSDALERPAWVEDGQAPEGCVPYSPDRPGAYVCGELPSGWSPPPTPGTSLEYPEACEVASRIIQERAEDLSRELQLDAVFRIDPARCEAAGQGGADEAVWMARFPLVERVAGPDGGPYSTAVVTGFTMDGTTPAGEEPPVYLAATGNAGS